MMSLYRQLIKVQAVWVRVAVTLYTGIGGVHGSNIIQNTFILTEVFCSFPQFL
jgi:hypothetical protein